MLFAHAHRVRTVFDTLNCKRAVLASSRCDWRRVSYSVLFAAVYVLTIVACVSTVKRYFR